LLWAYSDEVWRRCGDTATDYNYYTKRILFNSAYAATELFMLTDQSPQRFATWHFLSRRMGDIENLGRGIADVKVVGEAVFDGALSLLNMFKTPPNYEFPIDQAREQYSNDSKKVER
jgi:ubiquinone biosynthesis protein COQ9